MRLLFPPPRLAAAILLLALSGCGNSKNDAYIEKPVDDLYNKAMDALVVGDPFDPATEIGPIVTEAQRDELVAQVEEARRQGAIVHADAKVPEGDGWWFPPTVLSAVTMDMAFAQEEIFGPVAMVIAVPDLSAAIEAANATTFGLGSSVWSDDDDEIARCVEEIEELWTKSLGRCHEQLKIQLLAGDSSYFEYAAALRRQSLDVATKYGAPRPEGRRQLNE